MQTRINAILSDYDGTLSPTDSLMSNTDSIPEQLVGALWKASQRIPVCIISSKDYHFIHRRAKFARVLSCIMGIETIALRIHKNASNEIEEGSDNNDNLVCIKERYLLPNSQKILQANSSSLSKLAENIELEFKANAIVERKFTIDRQFLAGITIDYRHLKDWKLYKNQLEPGLKEMIRKYRSFSSVSTTDLYVLTYRSHPFLDIYALYCDKGMAFDLVVSDILNIKNNELGRGRGILYLGDSENDNPAFRKASVSVGVISDKRLTPMLDCQYLIEFNNLSYFLEHLVKNEFIFSEDLFDISK
jgi:HAD superfamily hydrolase (TIGR01484 family)